MMKRLFAILLCLALLTSAALAEGISVDVDFTRMDAESAVNTLYDMLDTPEESQGRTVRLKGIAYAFEGYDDEAAMYFLAVDDPTASCCGGLQLEFIPTLLPVGVTGFAMDGEEVTVTGTLDFYDDDGYTDLRIINAAVTLPII